MDTKYIKSFIETVESGSFSIAAKNLYLSQPTVSFHIQSLEKDVGHKLLTRSNKGIELTSQGEIFYSYGKKIITTMDLAAQDLDQYKNKTLNLYVSSAVGFGILPGIISDFADGHGPINFNISSMDSTDIIKKIQINQIKIGLLGNKNQDKAISFYNFADDELVLACPNNDYYKKLLDRENPIEIIKKSPLIIREEGSATHIKAQEYLENQDINIEDLNIVGQIDDAKLLEEFIVEGLGISILSKKAASKSFVHSDLLLTSLSSKALTRPLYIAYKDLELMNDLENSFINYLKNLNKAD